MYSTIHRICRSTNAQAHGAQQSLEFSIYVAALFSISYVLSRLPNNPLLLLALFRDRLSALSLHALAERIHSHQQKKALLAERRKQHASDVAPRGHRTRAARQV